MRALQIKTYLESKDASVKFAKMTAVVTSPLKCSLVAKESSQLSVVTAIAQLISTRWSRRHNRYQNH